MFIKFQEFLIPVIFVLSICFKYKNTLCPGFVEKYWFLKKLEHFQFKRVWPWKNGPKFNDVIGGHLRGPKFGKKHFFLTSDFSCDILWRHQIWDHFFMVKPLYIALISSKINIFRRNLDKKCIIFKTHWKFSRFFQFSRKFRFWIIFEPNSPPGNIFMPSNLMILLVLLHIYH